MIGIEKHRHFCHLARHPMKVLLTSHGSTGDIFPFIALGKALQREGHDVSFATAPLFEAEIHAAGLRFVYLPPDWGQSQFNDAMLQLTKAKTVIHTLQIIYRNTIPFVDDVIRILEKEIAETDVVVSSYLFPHYRIIAERFKRPFAIVTFCHNVVPGDGSPPPHPISKIPFPRFLQKYWVRVNWHLSNKLVDAAINRVVGKNLINAGLPKFKDFLLEPAELALVPVSKALFEPETPYSKRFRFVGYMRWQSRSNPETLAKVKDFVKDGPVPVLTFGSVTFRNKDEVVQRFLDNWPKGKKIIIQKGWVDFRIPKACDYICEIGSMSHDELFAHASVVIHHGGAGTSSSGLHAGVPQIIIPHIGDQPFWAREVRTLGAGKKISRRNWPERLPKTVEAVEKDRVLHLHCKAIAALLAKEDGPTEAARVLKEFTEAYYRKLSESK
jgi:vancomycin aglycone glucosyltransferase